MLAPRCWLYMNAIPEPGREMGACSGRLIRAHLIPKQLVARQAATLGLSCGSLVLRSR